MAPLNGFFEPNLTQERVGLIRRIQEQDASAFLSMLKRLDEETNFMMYEPGERQTTIEQQEELIRGWNSNPGELVLVCEVGQDIAGYVALKQGQYRRNSHCAYLVIGVSQAYAGMGIGKRLMQAAESWACENHLRRLELTVMTHNIRAVRLYKQVGFVVEGIRRQAMRVGARYVDEYYMGKMLDDLCTE